MKIEMIICILLLSSLIACEKNESRWEMSPCNFPSEEAFNDLRTGYSFKIIDAITFVNLVDTINASIHPDSVRLFDDHFKEIEISSYDLNQYRDEYIFGDFYPYESVPLNDDKALLELDTNTYYLSTSYNDIDTIVASFEQCLLKEFTFNNQSIFRPSGENSKNGASLYFKK
jgi:hypothetical protein